MGRRERMVASARKLMDQPVKIRNICTIAHIDHGKTTLSDNLIAGAGIISMELAAQQLIMDFDEMEQARGITINAANISMVHEVDGEEYLINLIDTPGHVDFGGDVTRAMRAVDGAIVLVDAVEAIMPQTETVLRQALREGVKPILFINKVDRLINELKVSPQEMQIRLGKIIDGVNKLIKGMSEQKYSEGWRVEASQGTVAFGSAKYKWGISVPYMQKSNITFKEIYDYCKQGKMDELAKLCPLYIVVLDTVVKHLQNPLEAQKSRIPIIWKGDLNSEIGKAMLDCNRDGPIAFMITDIVYDPHAGEVAVGRLFSGTLMRGVQLNISGTHFVERVQQVSLFMGGDREEVESIPAGNIAAVTGLKQAVVGTTASAIKMTPFESIKHYSEPVMTVAVEAKNMKDLPKLIEVLRQLSKEDPTLQVQIDEETGEHLMSGMGELHLEIKAALIERDWKVPITTSTPIVVYRESAKATSPPVEGKSPNRHNRFYIVVEPLGEKIVEMIKLGDVSNTMQELERRKALIKAGMDKEEAKNVVEIFGTNMFLNMTKGIQYLNETMELVLEGYHEALRNGPLTREPCQGIKVKLVDVKLHEDAVHRGPAQVIPAVRQACHAAILMADPVILEPIQKVTIFVPEKYMGNSTAEIQGRRGQIYEIRSEGDITVITGNAPVAELFGFAGDMRSATEGRAIWNTENAGFAPVPPSLQPEVIGKIRQRKGLKAELPKPSDFVD